MDVYIVGIGAALTALLAGPQLLGQEDALIGSPRLPAVYGEWSRVLADETSDDMKESFRRHERAGRPIGSDEFLRTLEKDTGRQLGKEEARPQAEGRLKQVWK